MDLALVQPVALRVVLFEEEGSLFEHQEITKAKSIFPQQIYHGNSYYFITLRTLLDQVLAVSSQS